MHTSNLGNLSTGMVALTLISALVPACVLIIEAMSRKTKFCRSNSRFGQKFVRYALIVSWLTYTFCFFEIGLLIGKLHKFETHELQFIKKKKIVEF